MCHCMKKYTIVIKWLKIWLSTLLENMKCSSASGEFRLYQFPKFEHLEQDLSAVKNLIYQSQFLLLWQPSIKWVLKETL